MGQRTQAITDDIQKALDARRILDLIDYRTDTIIETDSVVKSFCPIHGEMVFRTLLVDPDSKRFKCSYSLCPGHAGGDLIELYSKAKKVERMEAITALVERLGLDVDLIQLEAESKIKKIVDQVEPLEAEAEQPVEKPVAEEPESTPEPEDEEVAEDQAEVIAQEEEVAPEPAPEPKPEPAAVAPEPEPEPVAQVDPLENALTLLSEGNWQAANEAFSAILAADSGNIKALMGRSKCLRALDQIDALVVLQPEIIRAGLATNNIPIAQQAFRTLCECTDNVELIVANLHVLIPACRAATGGLTPLVEGLMMRAEQCEAKGDFRGALTIYRATEPIAPLELDLSSFIINLLSESGQTDEAIALCEQRLEAARQTEILSNVLEQLHVLMDLDPSRVDLRQEFIESAIEDGLSPDLFKQVLKIIDGWINEEEFSLGREATELLLHYLPDEIELHIRLGRIAHEQDDVENEEAIAYRIAELCRRAGKPAEAVRHLEAFRRGASSHEHTAMLAQCQFEAGKIDDAVASLEALLATHREEADWAACEPLIARLSEWQPHEPRWRAQMAECHKCQGNFEEALSLYEQTGMEFLSVGRLDEAAKAWGEALGLNAAAVEIAQMQHGLLLQLERSADAKTLLDSTADYLRRNRSPREAAEFILGCIRQEALDTATCLRLADLWIEAQDQGRAIESLKQALEQANSAGDEEVQMRVAKRWLALEPNNSLAIEILATSGLSPEESPENQRLLERLGETCIKSQEWDQAIEVYSKLREMDPQCLTFLERLIECHENRGNRDDAHRHRIEIAQIHFANGDWRLCREVLGPLMAGMDPIPQVRNLVFCSHIEEGQGDEAAAVGSSLIEDAIAAEDYDTGIEIAQRVLNLKSGNPEWMRQLLRLQVKANRADEAIKTGLSALAAITAESTHQIVASIIQRLVAIAPEDRAVRSAIVRAFVTIGDHEAAMRHRMDLAKLHRIAGEDTQAEEIYRDVLAAQPECDEASEALCDLLIARGTPEEATTLLWDRALKLIDKEKVDESIGQLHQLLEIDPMHTEARRQLADLLRSQLRNDEAVEQLANLAQGLMDDAEFGQAIATWEEAIGLRPEVVPYHQALISCQLGAGEVAVQSSVEDLMNALISRKEFDEALTDIDRFETLNSELALWDRWRGEIYTQKGETEKALDAFRRHAAKLEAGGAASTSASSSGQSCVEGMPLNRDATFETFIVGDRNNFAFATCKAVAENPAQAYNPLFLYSDVGLGKTHLINAIGNAMIQHNPKARILFTSMEQFISGLIDAIQSNRIAEFRLRHRRADVLLIDDVQFLANKERAQEEFFHLFNTLHQARKQIVLTSDRPPREMTFLEKRLRSRFGSGVTVDIQTPDLETRMAIVRRMAKEATGGSLNSDVIDLIAQRCSSNVRELKGALTQLVALSTTRSDPISTDEANSVLDQLIEA